MNLYINGSDIEILRLGLLVDEQKPHIVEFHVGPDEYLGQIEQFITEAGHNIRDIKGILIVTGPGSATALRSSLAIADTLHFSFGIPLAGIHLTDGVHDEAEYIMSREHIYSEQYLYPEYIAQPKITATKRDQLKRRV